MKRLQLLTALMLFAWLAAPVQAHPPRGSWSVGVNFGPALRPYPYPYPYYYRPYPYRYYYVEPAPIIVEPPPVVLRPAPVVVPATPVVTTTPAQVDSARPAHHEVNTGSSAEAHLVNLRHPDETVRRNSVMELGRMRALQALEPLTATLAGDKAPSVRDAAARALGLISSPRALTALTHAAQADPDRDVRNSAQFAVEIIRTNPR